MTAARVSDSKRLLKLVEKIYEAGTDPALMQRLPMAVADHFDTDSCLFHFCYKPSTEVRDIPRNARFPIGTANFDLGACKAYAEYYHERNEWYARGWKKGFPVIVLGDELMRKRELLRTEWSDYCRITGMFELIGAQWMVDGDLICAMGIHRPRGGRAFGEEDRRELDQVLPHLQRAFQIHERLQALPGREMLAFDVLDGLAVGVAVVDAQSRLLFANRIADGVLSSADGLTVSQGRVRALDARRAGELARAIAEAAGAGSTAGMAAGDMIVIERLSGSKLTLLVAPLGEGRWRGTGSPAAALVFCETNNTALVPERALAKIYGLTAAEARMLAALATGQRLAEFAAAAHISIGTARIHLKHILSKTGYHRQVDLIRAITRNQVLRLTAVKDIFG